MNSTASSQLLSVEEVRPAVMLVTMRRGEKRNALSNDLKQALTDVANELAGRADVGAVVLTGDGPVFSAGNDLREDNPFGEDLTTAAARLALRRGAAMTDAIAAIPAMTIAAINGSAVGGGAAIALACDIRVMAEDAWLRVPEVELGLPLGWNTLPRLVALVGPAKAKFLAAACARIAAPQVLEYGLCEAVAADPVAYAIALAEPMAKLPRVAQQMVKEEINRLATPARATGFEVDQVLLARDDPEGKRARTETVQRLSGQSKR